jgi:hypothetical protein
MDSLAYDTRGSSLYMTTGRARGRGRGFEGVPSVSYNKRSILYTEVASPPVPVYEPTVDFRGRFSFVY